MRHSLKTLLRVGIALLLVGVIGGYAYAETVPFLHGPSIAVLNPLNGETVHNDLLSIKGSVRNVSFISMNGRPIFTNENGVFNEQLLLYPGYNVITLSAKDRLGRTAEQKVQVIYQPEPKATARANEPTPGTGT